MKKVMVVGGMDLSIQRMFFSHGWDVTFDELDSKVNLIQFTGGADVDPSYYGEQKHAATHSNPNRDAREANLFQEFKGKIPMSGICRGGQFLNVMNGGKMWQHVNNHAIGGTHEALDLTTNQSIPVTSTHHQMIIPSDSAIILMVAREATTKQGYSKQLLGMKEADIESVFYPSTNSLCYQPHPEYTEPEHPCQVTYFNYLETFFNL